MEIDILNPYVMKILICARREDSINAISKRIGLSYGWTYNWIKRLVDIGTFKVTKTGLLLQENDKFYDRVLDFIKENFKNDISFHYSVLSLFGIKYCFTKTDAVLIWTNGGYNISRYRGYYPIFIKIKKSDNSLFEWYCKKLGLHINSGGGGFYSVELLEDFDVSYKKGIPVDTLDLTIAFMKKNIYNFEPALEMIQDIYGKKFGIKYKEAVTNVL